MANVENYENCDRHMGIHLISGFFHNIKVSQFGSAAIINTTD